MSQNPSSFTPTPYEPSAPASFTPTQGNYKNLQPFRYWCQKVLPLVYDDSLSYYELLCKVVDYLNKTMEDVETLHDDVDNLHTAYGELQEDYNTKYAGMTEWINQSYQDLVTFVNTYFANLDVQTEINNKLDVMASDGSLSALIEPLLPTPVDAWLTEHITNPSNPPLDTSLTLANAAAPAKTVGDKAFIIRDIPSGTTTFASLTQNGVYSFSQAQANNITDFPSNISPTVCSLLNYIGIFASKAFTIQKLILTNLTEYTRILISSTGEVYKNWSLTTPINTYSLLTVPTGTTKLANLHEHGTYHIESSVAANITDFPSGVTPTLSTLFNYIGCFQNGNYIVQRLELTNGSTYERMVVATDSSVYKNWERVDIDNSSVFKERNIPSGTTTFASLKDSGIYDVSSSTAANITDFPNGISPTLCTILNFTGAFNGTFTIQKIIFTGLKEYTRILVTNTGAVYKDWTITDIFDVFRVVYIPDNCTSFQSLTSNATYALTTAQCQAITDFPADEAKQTCTLFNYTKCFHNHQYTIQRLVLPNLHEYSRILYVTGGTVYLDWIRTDCNANNVLSGKKLVTAGDSYTAALYEGDYAEYNGKNFGYYIAKRNNMPFVNSGISGSTMTVTDPPRSPFAGSRYNSIPNDTKYLTLWFGINDQAYATLGTIDDAVDTTFYGAWNKVLGYYLTNLPFMKVLIIITGHTSEEYNQAIRNVAAKWGYPVLDLSKDMSIPAMFGKEGMSTTARDLRRAAFGWDDFNAHPNPQWHEYYASVIENALRKI